MFDQIKQLITNGNESKALDLIREELKKSFDFSKKDDNLKYKKLQDLQEKAFDQLLNSVANGRLRNLVPKIRKQFADWKTNSIKPELSQYEALAQIEIQKSTGIISNDIDEYLFFIDKDNIPIKLFSDYTLSLSKEQQHENCLYLDINGKICYTFLDYPKSENYDYKSFIYKLSEIIDYFYSFETKKIGIVFDENKLKNNIGVEYFLYVLAILITHITFRSKNSPIFILFFQQEYTKILFETGLQQYEQPKHKLSDSVKLKQIEKLEALIKECWTQDKKYIDKLGTLVKVINEDDTSLILLGERGVGKTWVAEIIHKLSNRYNRPYNYLNCGSLDDQTLNQQLFGSKKGSFTDAKEEIKSLILESNGGTLFLDEIDRTSNKTRNALITFIERKTMRVLGETKERKADVRLIFATNKDLIKLSKEGNFELDFLDRINRIFRILPLRQRLGDIDLIISNTLDKLNKEKKSSISMGKKERTFLTHISTWPKNVRGLVHYVQNLHADARYDGINSITLEQIKTNSPPDEFADGSLDDYETLIDLLRKFLSKWNQSENPFRDEIIDPILAKLYKDDCFQDLSKDDKWLQASKILGVSGGKYYKSDLQKAYVKFPDVKKKLGFDT